MKVLVIGSGGREHTICWALKKSAKISALYCAPGNGGISKIAKCIDISASDIEKMTAFAKEEQIDFVVVAPEDPLALGMVDAMEEVGIPAFGPKMSAAKLESSKIYAKSFMEKYNIPTASYRAFNEIEEARAHILELGAPLVVKADGLALGKGVVVAMDIETALQALDSMMIEKKFGDSGKRVIVEEYLTGPEVTVLVFTDGKTIKAMPSSQDHKRVFTGDLGPNTGGMGAFCPSPNYTEEIARLCMETIIEPTITGMNSEGSPFKGVLYFGLMLTPQGPKVIEYNVRFGDPEAQPVLSMLETDLLDIFEAVVDERLHELDISWRSGFASCVVMASGGYPDKYETGYVIKGLDSVPEDITVFHAATAIENGDFVTNGGRILGITAIGETLPLASSRAYDGVSYIDFKDAHYRTDIGDFRNNG